MSFSFGFSGDDIEDDSGSEEQAGLVDEMVKHSISESTTSHSIKPKTHSLRELLQHIPSQISYNALTISPLPKMTQSTYLRSVNEGHSTQIQRRSLFDIRAQLMAEVNPEEDDISDSLLSGLENGDLTSGVYEGGFKTWECALDLASLCAGLDFGSGGANGWDVVELGAGSAIPSLTIVRNYLGSAAKGDLRMTLCDYNEDVLRLATAPNLLVNYLQQVTAVASSSGAPPEDISEEGELDVEALGPEPIENSESSLRQRGITVNFLSGGWGDAFIDKFATLTSASSSSREARNLLILASETIYSLTSTKIFAETLLQLIRRHRETYDRGDAKAWVAAKKVYFGVGGGVDDFVRQIESQHGEVRLLYETSDTGVGRVILEVSVPT
ncbi:hypothetical protein LTR84_002459 [Exophiala bonariae]|uniref:protein-histidine N-methyltransferase n=1 Tax=Exophiala bonariae TaxID=1690606 RepID=A0AAV9NBV1_9EURO|nr:hypothetical protein LTR84_002459 [Exophiala bonariae]